MISTLTNGQRAKHMQRSEWPDIVLEQLREVAVSEGDRFPQRSLQFLANHGALQWPFPEQLLGLLKQIGSVSLPLARVFEGHVNALFLIQRFGTASQSHRVAQLVSQEDLIFGVWNTGPANSPRLLETPDGYRLIGGKTFATGAGRIGVALVTAALPDGGWQMCMVPAQGDGVRVDKDSWSPLGMDATESYAVEFSLSVRDIDLVGAPGDYYAEPFFSSGAFRFAAIQLGAAEALVDACVSFLLTSGRGEDLLQLRRLGEMATLQESGRHWVKQSSEWLGGIAPNSADLVRAQAQMTRIATEEICTRIVQLTQLCTGARGLVSPEPFGRRIRDLQMYLRQAGYDAAFVDVGRQLIQRQRTGV